MKERIIPSLQELTANLIILAKTSLRTRKIISKQDFWKIFENDLGYVETTGYHWRKKDQNDIKNSPTFIHWDIVTAPSKRLEIENWILLLLDHNYVLITPGSHNFRNYDHAKFYFQWKLKECS